MLDVGDFCSIVVVSHEGELLVHFFGNDISYVISNFFYATWYDNQGGVLVHVFIEIIERHTNIFISYFCFISRFYFFALLLVGLL